MKYYKATNMELKSVAIRGEAAIQYKLGEFVEAKIPKSGLLVFDSLQAFRSWAVRFNEKQIFECECEERVPLPVGRLTIDYHHRYESLWKGAFRADQYTSAIKFENGGSDFIYSWPPGTHAFRKVKLVRKITLSDEGYEML